MMLAAVKTNNLKEMMLKNIDVPKLETDEVLIKVHSCGICGSDLHAFVHSKGYEFVKTPLILGHEISGEIAGVYNTNEDSELEIGSRVVVESMQYCGECDNCQQGRFSICTHNKVVGLHQDGGLAEFLKVHKRFIRKTPDNLPDEVASLSEPMAVAVHAVKKLKEVNSSHHILINGPGIIGFFIGMICKYKGAKVTLSGLESDLESRLKKGEKFDLIPYVATQKSLKRDVDFIFECSGSNAALLNGYNSLKKGGKVVIVALFEESTNIFLTDLVRNEWDIITSYGSDPDDYEYANEILLKYKKELTDLISVYKIEDVRAAFDDSLEKKVLKSVVNIN